MNDRLGIGIVGAGGFAAFAAHAFAGIKGIQICGIYDVVEQAATVLATDTGTQSFSDLEELLANEQVDLIYIATPPYLHYQQSRQALEAGKHVICEKPAALHTHHAATLAELARQHDLLYVVNLMQRYNPLYELVRHIIAEKWLGDFVHGFFENYASDEKLTPDHWFWDRSKSGGIFIEHAVHFFDMFEGWLGKGELVHSLEIARDVASREVIDRVQAVVHYDKSPVNFYHGFNQPKVLDRQELRLQFDRGDITLYEWVPVKIKLHGLFSHSQISHLISLLPDAVVNILHGPENETNTVTGKFKTIQYDVCATITAGDISEKMDRYEQLLISMMNDQVAWIRDRSHQRVITEQNAIDSLRIAEEATNRAFRYDK